MVRPPGSRIRANDLSSGRPAPLRRAGGGDPEQGRLDLQQALDVAADPGRGIVVEERLAEPHDRVAEGGGLDRWLVVTGPNLVLDQLDDHGHNPWPDLAGIGGDDPRRVALLPYELTQRRRLRNAAVEAIERRKKPAPAAPPGSCACLLEEGLGCPDQHLSDQALTGAEPAVDRRTTEAELGGNRLHVNPLPAQVAVQGGGEDVLAAGPGGTTAARNGGRRGRIYRETTIPPARPCPGDLRCRVIWRRLFRDIWQRMCAN